MFSLFKKTSWKIEGKAFQFFDELFKLLPTEFQFLSEGFHCRLYKRFSINHAMESNHYTIGFDTSQSDKFLVKGKQFQLKNILVIQDGNKFPLSIVVYDGLWIGFEIEKNILNFSNFRFDLSRISKSIGSLTKHIEIERLINGLYSEKLELNNLSILEVQDKYYYQIKDLEDGNYLALDNKGQVFRLIHDPYKVELISTSIKQFVDDVNNEIFDISSYVVSSSSDK